MNVLEIMNMECQAARMQFTVISQVLDYVAEVVYHHFMVGSKEREGMVILETWEM